MATSRHIGAYADIIADLDTMMRHDSWPVEYRCATYGDALTWRSRANRLRMILRRKEEATHHLPSGLGTCEYDSLVFSLNKGERTVIIRRRDTTGKLIIDGEEVEAISNDALDVDDLAGIDLSGLDTEPEEEDIL